MTSSINMDALSCMPVLESPRLVLRELRPDDIPRLLHFHMDEAIQKQMAREPFQTVKEAETLYNAFTLARQENRALIWAFTLKPSDLLVGYGGFVQLYPQHEKAELGYGLMPAFWKKGLATEAVSLMVDYGFNEIRLHRLEAVVFEGNVTSINLLKKFGFHQEAHFKESFLYRGCFIDSYVFAQIKKKDKLCK